MLVRLADKLELHIYLSPLTVNLYTEGNVSQKYTQEWGIKKHLVTAAVATRIVISKPNRTWLIAFFVQAQTEQLKK